MESLVDMLSSFTAKCPESDDSWLNSSVPVVCDKPGILCLRGLFCLRSMMPTKAND